MPVTKEQYQAACDTIIHWVLEGFQERVEEMNKEAETADDHVTLEMMANDNLYDIVSTNVVEDIMERVEALMKDPRYVKIASDASTYNRP